MRGEKVIQNIINDGVIIGEIFRSPRMTCRLGWYPPFHWQAQHAHSNTQVSFLLSGEFRERAYRRERSVAHNSMAVKPQGAEHAVAFGPNGALIVSFDLDGYQRELEKPLALADGNWHWHASVRARHLVADLSRHLYGPIFPSVADIEDMFWDIVSAQDDEAMPKHNDSPPLWLSRVKKVLDHAPSSVSVSAVASGAGVHRTHLARSFSRYFGVSVSAYRRRVLAESAVKYLASGAMPATASCKAGFADQSHMTRVVKAETGFTPGVLRRFLFEAAGTT